MMLSLIELKRTLGGRVKGKYKTNLKYHNPWRFGLESRNSAAELEKQIYEAKWKSNKKKINDKTTKCTKISHHLFSSRNYSMEWAHGHNLVARGVAGPLL